MKLVQSLRYVLIGGQQLPQAYERPHDGTARGLLSTPESMLQSIGIDGIGENSLSAL